MTSDQSYTLDIQAQAERPPSAADNAYERFDSETLGWLRANDLDGVADHIESLYAALDAAAAVDGDALTEIRAERDSLRAKLGEAPPRDKMLEEIVTNVVRDVAELEDRNSPSDDPTLMLVRDYELEEILRHRLEKIELSADAPAHPPQISDDVRSLLDEAIAALEVHSCACGDECFEGKREGLAVPIRACIHWKTKTTLAKLRAARND